jgi:hypothetical protein
MQETTFLILTALAQGPQHGYGIIQDVGRIPHGHTVLSDELLPPPRIPAGARLGQHLAATSKTPKTLSQRGRIRRGGLDSPARPR